MANAPHGADAPFNPLLYFREQGFDSHRRRQFSKAITAFDKAHVIDPADVSTILGRSAAKSKHFNFGGALRDAELAMRREHKRTLAQILRAKSLFDMGEFEQGLANFHRGLRMRTRPRYFEEGVMQAEETVEDCIGRNVGNVLVDLSKTIQKMDDQQKMDQKKRVEDEPDEVEVDHGRKKRIETNDRVIAEKYLGRLAHDKHFLTKLKDNPNLMSANKEGSAQLKKLAEEAAGMLTQHQDFLRARQPFYSLKYHEATVSDTMKRRKQEEFEHKQFQVKEDAKKMMDKLRQARATHEIKDFLDAVDLAMEYFNGKSKKLLPKKDEFLDAVYNISALAFLDQKRVDLAFTERHNMRRVHFDLGLPYLHNASVDLNLQKARMPIIDANKYIREQNMRLNISASALERAWIFHELARVHLDLNQTDRCRLYAKKCINEAKPINNLAFCILAGLILAKLEISQRNKTDAKAALGDALESANHLQDHRVLDYVKKANAALEEADFEEFNDDEAESREKDIIKLMTPHTALQGDMKHLLRRMSVMPPSRRMSIMPGAERKKKVITIEVPPEAESTESSLRIHNRSKSAAIGMSDSGPLVKRTPESAVSGGNMRRRSVAPARMAEEDFSDVED